SGRLHSDFRSVQRFSKEIIRLYRSAHNLSRPVSMLFVSFRQSESQIHFEFWQNVLVHIQGNLCSIRRIGSRLTQNSAQMIGSEVHFARQSKFRRTNPKLV